MSVAGWVIGSIAFVLLIGLFIWWIASAASGPKAPAAPAQPARQPPRTGRLRSGVSPLDGPLVLIGTPSLPASVPGNMVGMDEFHLI